MPKIARIDIFPIKSLDGASVTEVEILASGALKGDREFAIIDNAGRFVNGKRNAKVHLLRSVFDLDTRRVTLWVQGDRDRVTFDLDRDRSAMSEWLSAYFEQPVQIAQNLDMGFPDDTDSPGPTIISTATINAIASWFPPLTDRQVQRRLRTNLELDAELPFWEDRLFATAGDAVIFKLGDVTFEGINPCQRCVVPTRDPETGDVYDDFQKIFVRKRDETLPEWTERSRFNHFYRLAINTRISPTEAGKKLIAGDEFH
ncbi:MOSC domain-containing protein [Pseudanabaena sp. PCC 6802]|uniref:MOSC domain-containing protein n=1 Tax=Pseudanabaena sp. PCC 6802 TaxID=118173 RepID=UPI0003481FC2|nr:MOSC N-terminal beta barrel domain-containing protein [Pseudanabaena sp. PCC 6802]